MALFDKQKAEKLGRVDLSRKGSVDAPIADFLSAMNGHEDYVSLSSCSGRIIVFQNVEGAKRGCEWILVKHERIVVDEVWPLLVAVRDPDGRKKGPVTLKFEPFIVHVQCRDFDAAKRLLTRATESGFRNSGLTFGKSGKVVLAVRSTLGLEVPLSNDAGEILVDENYVRFVVGLANDKLDMNAERIRRLEKNCSELFRAGN